ncbi:hypothetical protein [Altericroceibacterium endophyticum]|uniref:hypothetical protein n=1 Tax=Altericroceibacterium endophyticum TaxID=1808508 RepID=UPI001F3DB15F|nr:hypothetical protein [Altericroceibacterium endophyticum]
MPGEKASPTQPIPTWPLPYTRMSFTPDDINPLLPEEDQQKLRELFTNSRWGEGPYIPPSICGTISFPGANGGANWGNVASDPRRQRIYVVSRELPLLINLRVDNRPESKAAIPNGEDDDIVPYRWPTNFLLQSNGMVAIKPPLSFLTAYDMNSGEQIWRISNGEIMTLEEQGITGVGSQTPRGGPVATAGGCFLLARRRIVPFARAMPIRAKSFGNTAWMPRQKACRRFSRSMGVSSSPSPWAGSACLPAVLACRSRSRADMSPLPCLPIQQVNKCLAGKPHEGRE